MSLTRAQRARLGIFVLTGMVILLLLIAIPLGLHFSNKQKMFYSYFEGESLSGLEQGAVVKFRGIPIGKVNKINYDPSNLLRVKVLYEIDPEFPIKDDMYAQTGMIGITGLKYIEIMGGSNDSKLLKERSEIPSKPSLIANITGKTEVIIAKIELLLNNLTQITSPDSIARIRAILKNVEEISYNAKDFVNQSGYAFKDVVSSAQKSMHNVEQITDNVKYITGSFKDSLQFGEFINLAKEIDSTARGIRAFSATLDLTLKQSKEDFSVSLQNLRESLENLNELSKMLLENPSLFLKGDNPKDRSAE